MTATTEYSESIISLVSLAQDINEEIGNYEQHYINENFGFTVRLSNGSLKMSREVAQDYMSHPNSVTKEDIVSIANSFKK